MKKIRKSNSEIRKKSETGIVTVFSDFGFRPSGLPDLSPNAS